MIDGTICPLATAEWKLERYRLAQTIVAIANALESVDEAALCNLPLEAHLEVERARLIVDTEVVDGETPAIQDLSMMIAKLQEATARAVIDEEDF